MIELENILRKVQMDVNNGKLPVSIHIDELCQVEKTPIDFLEKSIQIFNLFTESIKVDLSLTITLMIELDSENTILRKRPSTLQELEKIVDVYAMPEIFVAKKELSETNVSKIEYYLCPLPFKLENLNPTALTVYSEYKRLDDYEYDSWLSIISR